LLGGRLCNGLHKYCWTGQHAINRLIACSIIFNRNIACGKRTRLDCCDMISVTDNLDMAVITLGRLFFILSYRFAPTNAPFVLHVRRSCRKTIGTLVRSHLSLGVDSEAIWTRLLVGSSVRTPATWRTQTPGRMDLPLELDMLPALSFSLSGACGRSGHGSCFRPDVPL
jgi:hypothetical protein